MWDKLRTFLSFYVHATIPLAPPLPGGGCSGVARLSFAGGLKCSPQDTCKGEGVLACYREALCKTQCFAPSSYATGEVHPIGPPKAWRGVQWRSQGGAKHWILQGAPNPCFAEMAPKGRGSLQNSGALPPLATPLREHTPLVSQKPEDGGGGHSSSPLKVWSGECTP